MSTSNKKIAKNTLILYFRMLFMMGVNLYTSRVILNVLGVEDYGIYNIVGGVVLFFSFLNGAMSSATQRFISFELGKNNFDKLRRIFSTSLGIHLAIIVLFLILSETLGCWFLNNYINIPVLRIESANTVFQFAIITFCFSFLQIPYNASIISYEKMGAFAAISIIDVFLKLFVVLLLQFIGLDKLIVYSLLLAAETFLVFILYYIYCKKKINICRFEFKYDRVLAKEMLSFTSWNLFGQVAFVASNQGINIVLNIFFGVFINAAMGIAMQVNSALMAFIYNFQTAFKPQLTMSYAQKNLQYMHELMYQTSKASYYMLFVLALPIMINMDDVLQIWLKNVPAYSSVFCNLIIIYSLTEVVAGPLFMAVFASGNIKKYQIYIGILFLMNVVFSYFLLKIGFPAVSVLYVKIAINFIILFVRLRFACKYVDISAIKYMKDVLFRIIVVTVFSLPIPILIKSYIAGISGLYLSILGSIVVTLLCVYFLGMAPKERIYLYQKIKKRL